MKNFLNVILTKQPIESSFSRLLKDPLRRKGHTLMTLCSKSGIEQKVITKKEKEPYKRVNKLKWGD
jgi:ribosomal protein RSM22 (predicted rRNA methylase)